MTDQPRIRGLYAIADSHWLTEDRFAPAVRDALAGGARIIQYRDKLSAPAIREAIARTLVDLSHEHAALFLVNDDAALARAVGADGVHLGREDMAIAQAREQLGPGAVIGISCYNDLERARAAERAGADYVAFGRFFPSRTKPQAAPATPALLRQARAALRVPIVAIGGITPDNGASLIDAGADALAVIEGVFGQPDIRAAAERYAKLFRPTP